MSWEDDFLTKKRKMELEAIKKIDPEIVLNDLSIPYRKRHSYYECRAVWRGDRHPSMTVFKDGQLWRWRDHGTGDGGTWIDLYMTARNMTYQEAVRYLREHFLGSITTEKDMGTTLRENDKNDSVEWKVAEVREKSVGNDTKAYLAIYRKIRHIPEWLKEIEYDLLNIKTGEVKRYKGFGVQDIRGNWHIRYSDPDMKPPKERVVRQDQDEGSTYSLIKKKEYNKQVCIVEGFIDAMRIDELLPQTDILILNGVENWKKTISQIQSYKTVYFCLDNDRPGRETEEELLPYAKEPVRVVFTAKDIDEAMRNGEKVEFKKLKNPHRGMRLDI